MGVIARWATRLAGLGIVIFGLTLAGVLGSSALLRSAHLDGRSLEGPVDAILVLGGGGDEHWADRDVIARRLLASVRLYETGAAPLIVSAGGGPTTYPGAQNAGQAYRLRLLEEGVPDSAILLEDRSLTTFQNMRFAVAAIRGREIRRVALVTDGFHMARSLVLAAYLTRLDTKPVVAPDFEKLPAMVRVRLVLRETLAWWYNAAKLAGWEALGLLGLDETEREVWIR